MNKKSNIITLAFIALIVILGAFLSSNDETQKKVKAAQFEKNAKTYERYKGNSLQMPQWEADADTMVYITPNSPSMKPYYIDAYEAIIAGRQAFSVAGQTPTTKLTYDEAKEACASSGKRLCTIEQWQTACRGGSTKLAVFPNTDFLAQHCDFARSKGYDKFDYPEKTNSHPQCNMNGVYHMIGNLSEFAQDEEGNVAVLGLTYYDAHIKNKERALSKACEVVVIGPGRYPANKHNEGMGFRCCLNIE